MKRSHVTDHSDGVNVLEGYTPNHLAIIIPTKDRPAQIEALLENFCRQTIDSFRVIIADGGSSAKAVLEPFRNRLRLTYLACPVPGQIRQRNVAISHLGENDRLVAFIDDDMVLAPDALERMLELWNLVTQDTAGIGFNLTNEIPAGGSFFKRVLLLDHPQRGHVLASGGNTPIGSLKSNVRSRWLGGGYTVWRRDILERYPYSPLNTKWAVGEDLRYSYPIGKRYPLWVCAKANIFHNHHYNNADLLRFGRYRGWKIVMSTLYFVRSYQELNLFACYWMLVGLSLSRFMTGVFKRKRYLILEAIGMAAGILRSILAGAERSYLYSEMEN